MLALSDAHVSVRWNAIRELGRMGPAAADAIPALKNALEDHDGTTALWAACALAQIDVKQTDPPPFDSISSASNASASISSDLMSSDSIPFYLSILQRGLQEKKRVFPGMAAAALAELGRDAALAVPILIVELTATHPDDRWSAAGALAAIGPDAHKAVTALIQTLRTDKDEKVRWYAAWALGQIGKASASAVPALIEALDDGDADVRGYAARALGCIGVEAIQAIPKLMDIKALEEGTVQAEVRLTLAILNEMEQAERNEQKE